MQLRVVMFGDIVGLPGRQAVAAALPWVRERYGPDLVIVNAENSANGSGLLPNQYTRLCELGVDGITLGDHALKKKQIFNVLDRELNIIRPANLSPRAVGRGWMKLTPKPREGQTLPNLYVITVLGRLFMSLPADDPFAAVDGILEQISEPDPLVLVEIHAEATSEKQAMGWHLDGRACAVVGTHTHVATADARVLPGGTGYMTDLGMSGPQASVLGRRVDRVLTYMTSAMPAPFDVAEEDVRACGVYLEIDAPRRRTVKIERIEVACPA